MRRRPRVARQRFVLWGARRGDLSYAFMTGERAKRERREVVGAHRWDRDYVTVVQR